MPSSVTQIAPADSAAALAHFESAFRFETDCWDVHDAMSNRPPGFRARRRAQPRPLRQRPCARCGQHSASQADRSDFEPLSARDDLRRVLRRPALQRRTSRRGRLARLGRPVKIMIGGMTGWLDEGFRTSRAARCLPQLFADDELQSRPGLVDGAHFDVDEAERQRDLAHRVFGDVGRDFRGLLRPRDPDRRVLLHLRHAPRAAPCPGARARSRRNARLSASLDLAHALDVFRQRRQATRRSVPAQRLRNSFVPGLMPSFFASGVPE